MVGYAFNVDREITVTGLGKIDANGNGVLDDMIAPQIGIWDSTNQLLVSTSIDPATAGTHGGFFNSIVRGVGGFG